MPVKFGTDGVRGVANVELTAEWALQLGRIAARVLCDGGSFAIGRDTRASGGMLSAALASGVASEGVDVVDLGVITTPAVAWYASKHSVPGAVISASHNPYHDNGVKFFGAGGLKLSDAEQLAIEQSVSEPLRDGRGPDGVGHVLRDDSLVRAYEDYLVESLEGRRLDALSVVVDCANGAASHIAPRVLRRLGAEVHAIADEPDGFNINRGCGSTDLSVLRREVLARGAHAGVAFDGDADRCLAVDPSGGEVDGDAMIALFAIDMADRGQLSSSAVAVTVMTNLGFRRAMAGRGIRTVETDVGDRSVLAAMESEQLSLGGEQSGHIIFREHATTGDGLLTAIRLLDLVVRKAEPLDELAAAAMVRLPQVLTSVKVSDPSLLASAGEIWAEVERCEEEMNSEGRVLVRASGTEPKIRVMVEATRQEEAVRVAERLCAVVEKTLA